MAQIDFVRNDLALRLQAVDEGSISIQARAGARLATATVSTSEVEASATPPLLLLNALTNTAEWPPLLADWQAPNPASQPFTAFDLWMPSMSSWNVRRFGWIPGLHELKRVTLELNDPTWAGWSWEDALRGQLALASWLPVLCNSPTHPRAFELPLAFPLQILDITTLSSSRLSALVEQIFGHWVQDPTMREVLQVAACDPQRIKTTLRREGWRQVDIMHFDVFPWRPPAHKLLLASSDTPGTLGWLMRLANRYLPRLIVINVNSAGLEADLSRLAAALLARGGPALVVGDFASPDDLMRCYDMLIHDEPLDMMAATTDWIRRPRFFAGAGREDALRTSQIGLELARWAAELRAPTGEPPSSELRQLQELLALEAPVLTETVPAGDPLERLWQHEQDWPFMRFDHERNGMIPIAQTVSAIRTQAGERIRERASKRRAGDDERYLNATLWRTGEHARLERISTQLAEPSPEFLPVGQAIQLGVQIGPRDGELQVIGAAPIIEKAFDWKPYARGRRVEIGIIGLDFEVAGEPVQEVWLPRHGASQTLYFTVAPRTAGAARLRVCLFYRNDLIQSLCLAVLTVSPGEPIPAADERRQKLAQALDVAPTLVGDVLYLARLEYSLTTQDARIDERGGRTISIIANHHNDEQGITIKGTDIFQPVMVNRDTPDLVQAVREAMLAVSVKDLKAGAWVYTFAADNAGDEEQFKGALQKLAAAGWGLYSHLLAGRKKLEEQLAGEDKTIHVAHVLLEDVIPWAALYDRRYDDRVKQKGGIPVDREVCLAPLRTNPGAMTQLTCGADKLCPLHPANIEQRQQTAQSTVTRESVVCPQHFWGFRHFIETPIQQVAPRQNASQGAALQGSTHELRSCVLAALPAVRLLVGYHADLELAKEHCDVLEQLTSPLSMQWLPPQSNRDRILEALENGDLDVIYLFCHARGGRVEPAIRIPYLEFKEHLGAQPGLIYAEDLDDEDKPWLHHPLVILNGCHTVGFSPDALPGFLRKIVITRGAAGVLGTEVSVHEYLATEMAQRFLGHFLNGESAGQALRAVRRTLLLKLNPLGLVYTLYAATDLKLDLNGDGKCT